MEIEKADRVARKTRAGYKVVLKKDYTEPGELKSAIIPLEDGGIIYQIGEYVTPKQHCGDLTCFRNLKAARNFVSGNSKLKIFKCRYEISYQDFIWCAWGTARRYNSLDLPFGTVLAKQIKLLKEVK